MTAKPRKQGHDYFILFYLFIFTLVKHKQDSILGGKLLTSHQGYQTPSSQSWIQPTKQILLCGLPTLSYTPDSTVETNKHRYYFRESGILGKRFQSERLMFVLFYFEDKNNFSLYTQNFSWCDRVYILMYNQTKIILKREKGTSCNRKASYFF